MRYRGGRRKKEIKENFGDVSFCDHPSIQAIYTTDIKLNCQCGDIGQSIFSWNFGHKNDSEVNFQQSDEVLGNTWLEAGRHHYWEIKILQPLQDKQLDVGIAAYSNNRRIQNFTLSSNTRLTGSSKNKNRIFCAGSLVGVHLDTIRGKLNFTVNRVKDGRLLDFEQSIPVCHQIKPLLYTKSRDVSFKLLYSTSYTETLAFSSAKCVSETLDCGLVSSLYGHIQNILYKNYPVLFTQSKYQDLFIALDHEDVAVPKDLAVPSHQNTPPRTTKKKCVLDQVLYDDYASSDDEYIFILKPKNRLDPEKVELILKNEERENTSNQKPQKAKKKAIETSEVPAKKSTTKKTNSVAKQTKKKQSNRVLKTKNE